MEVIPPVRAMRLFARRSAMVWRCLPAIALCLLLAAPLEAQESAPAVPPLPAPVAPATPAPQAPTPQGATPAQLPKPLLLQQSSDPLNTADLERRIRELEAIVHQLESQKAGSPPAPLTSEPQSVQPMALEQQTTNLEQTEPEAGGMGLALPPQPAPIFNPIGSEGGAPQSFSQPLPPGFAGWKDGFYIISPDEAFSLRITGQIQADYHMYANTQDRKDIDAFLLRRARFGLEATLFKYYEFRFLPDFGEGSNTASAPTPVIQDCYLNIHYCDEVQVELGKFKQPMSYEQLIQDRFVPTLERSLIDQLVPARDVGVMIHGERLFDNRLDYGVSVSNGEINGFGDTNDGKDVNGRFAFRPLNDPDFPDWLHYLQFGLSGTTGVEQEPINPASLKMSDSVTWFTFSSTTMADGVRWRACPEFAYFLGPFGCYAEGFLMDQQMEQLAVPTKHLPLNQQNVPFTGWCMLYSLLLTGESRTTYSEAVKPLHPFDPRNFATGTGALELVFAMSQLSVGDEVFLSKNPLAAKGQPNEATEYTLGFNWYMNEWVRVQFNWEHDVFSAPVELGAAPLRDQDGLFTRFQVQF